MTETINYLYKAEVIHRRGPWRSFEAVEFATLDFQVREGWNPVPPSPPPRGNSQNFARLSIQNSRLGLARDYDKLAERAESRAQSALLPNAESS